MSHETVGVEIEMAGLNGPAIAAVVREMLGGELDATSEHLVTVRGTRLGDFKIKLDTRYADAATQAPEALARAATEMLRWTEGLLPLELTAPPLPPAELPRLDDLVTRLARAGAVGTTGSPVAAFAVHFNPAIAATDTASLHRWLLAFALGYAWLAARVDANATRRLVGFATPYPEGYVEQLATTDYDDDRDRLVDDYLAFNPTRNRALDALPLLAHLDAARLARALPDEPVSHRPTLHYRLPDSRIGEPGWSLGLEWRRWLAIARVAEDAIALERLRGRFVAAGVPSRSDAWKEISTPWFESAEVGGR
ncbi:MAG: amidoligase family protein [Alphaproteobacteria bacterium]